VTTTGARANIHRGTAAWNGVFAVALVVLSGEPPLSEAQRIQMGESDYWKTIAANDEAPAFAETSARQANGASLLLLVLMLGIEG
jgi:hypothetical protein